MRKIAAGAVVFLPIIWGCSAGPDGMALAQTAERSAAIRSTEAQSSVVVRRVWVGLDPNFYASDPAPDGRSVTEIDWSTGDLAIRDLGTGELRRITNKGSWNDSDEYAERSIFSPDGQQVAYAWFNEKLPAYEFRAIGVDGSAERVLLSQGQNIEYLWPHDWSPDGRELLTTIFRADRTNQLTVVAAEGGSARVLRTFDWRFAFEAEFSPDGRYVAYDFPPDEDSRDRDIFALAADGSRETTLVAGPGDDAFLGWVPGGRDILFSSDRSGTPGIWKLPVADGRPAGEPELLRADVWGLSPLGFARDAYFYGVTLEQPQVHTATIDLATGQILSPPTPVGDATAGVSSSGDWSPDGEKLAYLAGSSDSRTAYLVIRSAQGDEKQQIALEIRYPQDLRWSPDGRSVVIPGRGDKGRYGLWRVDLATGTTRLIVPRDPNQAPVSGYSLSLDGETAYFRRSESTRAGAILARDLDTGRETVIRRVQGVGDMSISPDGTMIAFNEYDRSAKVHRLLVAPFEGGEAHVIYTTPAPNFITSRTSLPWTPDGKHILFVQIDDERGSRSLWKIPAAGGEAQKLLERDDAGLLRSVRLHPDGRRIAFDAGQFEGEIWVMENVPGLASARGSN